MEKAKAVLKDVTFVEDMNAVAEGCDALVVATEWDEFKKLDLDRARKALTHPIMFDGRNLFDPAEMEQPGLHLQEHRAMSRGQALKDCSVTRSCLGMARPAPSLQSPSRM